MLCCGVGWWTSVWSHQATPAFWFSAVHCLFICVPTEQRNDQFRNLREHQVRHTYTRRADKSLARPGRKQARKHVRDARDFNNVETRAIIKLFFLQGKAPKEIRAILTETLACFLPGRAKDLSAPLYRQTKTRKGRTQHNTDQAINQMRLM
jgi:hypothetical protein